MQVIKICKFRFKDTCLLTPVEVGMCSGFNVVIILSPRAGGDNGSLPGVFSHFEPHDVKWARSVCHSLKPHFHLLCYKWEGSPRLFLFGD